MSYQPGQFRQPHPNTPPGGYDHTRWQWFTVRSRKATRGIGCSTLIVLLLVSSSISAACSSSNPTAQVTPTPTTQQITALSRPGLTQPVQPTSLPTQTPTHLPTPKPTPKPTLAPTHLPTPRPTQPPPPPTPTPCPGINCNPWGYNFNPGNLIYYPPSNFCSYFNCISSFWEPDDPGDGYVVQCADSSFSQSGGERGACSYHGGVSRPLYSH